MAVSEWDQRQLCADGGCIGVIGSDGTCKVCGRPAPNWGDERMRGLIAPPQDEHGDDEDDEEYDDDGYEADDDDGEDGDGEDGDDRVVASSGAPAWGGRALCPDGSCIGVIGPDGRCKECGRAGDPAAAPAVAAAAAEPTAAPPQAPALEAPSATADDRERCADSACAGLIGADGRCAVCGKGAS